MNKRIFCIFVCFIFIISSVFSAVSGRQDSIVEKNIHVDIIDSCINSNDYGYRQINSRSKECSKDSYLINTEWGQWGPYNSKCPMNNEPGRPPFRERLGCWSVAIGQIINHHHSYYNLQTMFLIILQMQGL